MMAFTWATGRAQNEVSKLKLEVEVHSSSDTCPGAWVEVQDTTSTWLRQATTPVIPGTTDAWISWETTDIPTWLASDGTFNARLCLCGNVPVQSDYQFSIDTARITLNLIALPPVCRLLRHADERSEASDGQFHGRHHARALRLVLGFR